MKDMQLLVKTLQDDISQRDDRISNLRCEKCENREKRRKRGKKRGRKGDQDVSMAETGSDSDGSESEPEEYEGQDALETQQKTQHTDRSQRNLTAKDELLSRFRHNDESKADISRLADQLIRSYLRDSLAAF